MSEVYVFTNAIGGSRVLEVFNSIDYSTHRTFDGSFSKHVCASSVQFIRTGNSFGVNYYERLI